jgi:tetratricopeptide (TPR) repeat protein
LRILPLIAALFVSGCTMATAPNKTANINFSDDAGSVFGDYLSARFAAEHHDFNEAAKFYNSSLEHDPSDPQLLAFAFFYSASAGQIEDAAKLAQRLSVATPDDRAARLTLAVRALKHRDYKAAREHIAKSAAGPFTSFTVALIDAWAAAGAGQTDDAIADLKLLHAQHSADALAYFNEGMLAELLGRKDTAATDYKLAFDTAGPTPRVVDAYGRFLERTGRAEQARTELYMKLKDDDAFSVVVEPGLQRIAKGTIPEPLAPRAEDGAAEALFGIAASLNDDNSRDVSILYLRLALYLQPKLELASILLGNRCEALGKYEDAITAYREIGNESPYYRIAAVAVAVDMARLDKNDEAIASLKTLTAQHPSDVETWTALGDTYRAAKKFAEAAQAYDHAIQAASPPTKRSWPLYYAHAIAQQELKNWTAAEADLNQALTLSPNEPQVLNYLAYTWIDQHRNCAQAAKMLEKARSLAPQDGYIIDSVGWAYYCLGRYADATKALEDAIQLVPGDPTINDHLGDAYWKVGRKLDAKFQWSHALAFGAEPGDKARIEKKLQVGLNRDNRS